MAGFDNRVFDFEDSVSKLKEQEIRLKNSGLLRQ